MQTSNPPVDLGSASGDVHAAIDIGTNSFHLVVVRVDDHGGFDVLTADKEPVRLGADVSAEGALSDDAMDRGVATLARFRQVAESYNADLVALATSAVREAPNRDVFIGRAAAEARVQVDVIAGTEEARLIHLGVLQAVPIFDDRSLTVDIGGGSTELVIGQSGEMLAARSIKVGHIRLTQRFFPGGEVTADAVEDCRAYLRAFLVPATQAIKSLGFTVAAGSSGTITTIASLLARRRDPDSDRDNPSAIYADELSMLVDDLVVLPTPPERVAAIAGLEERRSDVIVAGALLLEEIFRQLDVQMMVASEFALREGALVDRMQGGEDGDFHRLSDIRRNSVLRFADTFEEDRSHVEHATDLALQLFDSLAEIHEFGSFERDLLEAGGLLHNVGLFVSHAAHHKHSYYVIRHSDRLNGFTDHEIELIAQVARYHRNSAPKVTHQAFTSMSEVDQDRIRIMSGILRIGIALDRTRSRAVEKVSARVESNEGGPEQIVIEPVVTGGADASLELYTARMRCTPLANGLNLAVTIAG